MKALIATGYGAPSVLTIVDVDRPEPKPNEILIRIHAASVSTADSMMRRGDPAWARLFLGLRRPKKAIPGTCLAGTVAAIGANVTRFKVGDRVFGGTGVSFGAHAEYVATPEDGPLVLLPDGMSFDDGAIMSDGPLTSHNFLVRLGAVTPGARVLVNGAAGSLGTAAIQLAKALGAEVTAVCGPANLALVRSLGADHVIDYTTADFAADAGRYDVIFDTVGKRSFGACKKALAPKGRYLSPVLKFGLLGRMLTSRLFGGRRAMFDATGLMAAPAQRAILDQLAAMVVAGELRSVVKTVHGLAAIPGAHEVVDSGHKRGNIVVRLIDAASAPVPT